MAAFHPFFLLQVTLSYLAGYTLPSLGHGSSLAALLLCVHPVIIAGRRIRAVCIIAYFVAGASRGVLLEPSIPPDVFRGVGETVRFFGEVVEAKQAGPLVEMVLRDGILELVSCGEVRGKISRVQIAFFGDSRFFSKNIGRTVIGLGRLHRGFSKERPTIYSLHRELDRLPYRINTERDKLIFFGRERGKTFREKVVAKIVWTLRGSDRYSMGRTFVVAVLTGERKFSSPVRETLVDTGLAHLLAISGLHVGVAIMLFSALARVVLLCVTHGRDVAFDSNVPTFFAGAVAGIFYVYLSGIPVTVARAYTMIIFSAAAVRNFDRRSLFASLSFALFLVAISDPASVASASFVFSFAVTFYLILLLGRKRFPGLGKMRANLVVSLTAYCVSIPLSAYFFGAVSLYGFSYNFLFVPLFIPLIALSLVWVFLCAAGFPFIGILGKGLVISADILIRTLRWCSSVTGEASMVETPGLINLLCYFAAFSLLLIISLKMGQNSDKFL